MIEKNEARAGGGVVVGGISRVVVGGRSGPERSVQVEVEADGLEDEALDANQVRSMRLLCLCVCVCAVSLQVDSRPLNRTDCGISLAESASAFEQVRDLVRCDLDITEFLEGVFEFARDEEGGERDVVVRELDEGEMEVEAVVELLGGCDGPAWAAR